MCGLVGFVGERNDALIKRMTDHLAHRGPDGDGFWIDDALGVHFGHRRLAIVDIAGGDQPMWNEDGSVGVIYNGQIYNHMELRQQLVRLGHVFKSSHSDTEVLVHGYEAWGTDLAQRLNGMFAFAIIDRKAGKLYLARDRFGEKPLYWSRVRGGIAFASELSTLALHPGVSSDVDALSLQKFFAYGFIPAPGALLRGVRKLPSGAWLSFDLKSREVSEQKYWEFCIEPDESLGPEAEDRLVDELRGRLHDAVKRRLMSDVPLGLFLSGGIDSSAVLAFARRASPADDIKTFNIGFTEASFDESKYATQVADHFGAHHRAKMLNLDHAQNLVPEVLGRLDEPMADPSIIPTFLVSQFTRQHVTVALAGDGGDELFAGYDPFSALTPAQFYQKLVPGSVHRIARSLAEMLPRSSRNMSFDFKLRRALLGLSYPAPLWNPVWLSPMSPELIADAFEAPLSPEELYSEALAAWNGSSHLSVIDRTLEYFTRFYLKDDILVKVDRAAMMNSLESRAVFLDNDLVDLVRKLPSHFKFRNGERKYLLKRALEGIVPDFVLARPKKGFGIPLLSWLRSIEVPDPVAPLDGLSNKVIRRLVDDQRSGRGDNRLAVWAYLALAATRNTASNRIAA